MSENRPRGYRSLFWPMILIGVGVVWLLSNLGWLPANSQWLLLNLWPLLLVGIGLDLIFARRLPAVGALIGLVLVVIVVAVLLAGPALNLPQTGTLQSKTLTVPLEQNQTATVNLELSSFSSNITALPASSPNLFDATVYYTGTLNFSALGSNGNMNIRLSHSAFPNGWFLPGMISGDRTWQIAISPKLPLNLTIDGASGSSTVDLRGLQLASLKMDSSSGSTNLDLPASTQPYTVDFSTGSGSADVSLPANTSLTLRLDGASGSINLNLPANPDVRVEVQNTGSGSVNVPGNLNRQSGGGRDKSGTWESASYASATQRLLIIVTDLGSGSFNIN